MNKLKFGDLVFDEFLGVCVVLNVSEHFTTIQNANGNFNSLANPDELKPVPHPDTARLDWLEKQRAAAGVWASSKVSITADGVQVETPTLRQTIDATMQQSE